MVSGMPGAWTGDRSGLYMYYFHVFICSIHRLQNAASSKQLVHFSWCSTGNDLQIMLVEMSKLKTVINKLRWWSSLLCWVHWRCSMSSYVFCSLHLSLLYAFFLRAKFFYSSQIFLDFISYEVWDKRRYPFYKKWRRTSFLFC